MTIQIIPVIVIFLNLLLAVFILTQNSKASSNRLFSLLAFLGALWITAELSAETYHSTYYLETVYALGALVICTGLIWVLLITDGHLNRKKIPVLLIVSLLFSICSYIDGFIINNHDPTLASTLVNAKPGWGLGLYAAFYLSFSFLILYKLYRSFRSTTDTEKKLQYRYVSIGASTTLIITALTSFTFPDIFPLFVPTIIDAVGFLIFLIFIAYTITRHHLFNIRVIAVEVVTVGLWTFILIRILLATTLNEALIEGALFILTVILGIILIRGVFKEIHQKERIEKLAADLEESNTELNAANIQLGHSNANLTQKVSEQTAEIRKAFELEKHARRELEKLNETKDQFIMLTQHHLRTPVTSIRTELEAILTGTYGKVTARLGQALHDTNTYVGRLTNIVDDFLDISTLKVGSQILDIQMGNLRPLIRDIIEELKVDIEKMHLHIELPRETHAWPNLPVDASKIREVLLIILENAVRYNVDKGKIVISNLLLNDAFEMTIENTGVGISPEDMSRLFNKRYFRSKQAQTANPRGMGIGLSVARAVVRAHRGELTIESQGENRGAKVILRLPRTSI